MIDSHCHLADPAFDGDLDAVVDRAKAAGLRGALCVLSAGDQEESTKAARARQLWPELQFAVGVHPHTAGRFSESPDAAAVTVRQCLVGERARVIGEIGLDYHYDFAPRPIQQEVFRAQVALARDLDLPIVVHTREADEDTLAIIRNEGRQAVRGVFHCFTGDADFARAALDLGFYISLSGIVTFPRSGTLREVARLIPEDRVLVETDAPYLAPVPYRGKRNEPSYVVRVIDEVASARGLPAGWISERTTINFASFLGPNLSHETA